MSNEDSIRAGTGIDWLADRRNELANTDDNDPQGRGRFFHRAHFLHRHAARPSKISKREGDVVPRPLVGELHKHAAREEEGRRMAADVRVLAREKG